MKIYTRAGFQIIGKVIEEYEETTKSEYLNKEFDTYVEIFETNNGNKYKAKFGVTGIQTDDVYIKYDFTESLSIEKI